MLKNFLLKQLVKTQLHKVPPEARDMIMKLVEEHPEILMQIAQDFEAERKKGKSDQEAMMATMQKHQETLKGILK